MSKLDTLGEDEFDALCTASRKIAAAASAAGIVLSKLLTEDEMSAFCLWVLPDLLLRILEGTEPIQAGADQ